MATPKISFSEILSQREMRADGVGAEIAGQVLCPLQGRNQVAAFAPELAPEFRDPVVLHVATSRYVVSNK